MVPDKDQNFKHTKADQKVREVKLAEKQKNKVKITCEGVELKNVFKFKYLDSIFAADGDHSYDVRRRIGLLAMTCMGQLRQVFNSGISLELKLRLYKSAICSLFTYRSEVWTLDESTQAAINGANARCLNRMTGRGTHTEANSRTRTYDLVGSIRKRRYKWLGHILRLKECRLVKHAVVVQFKNGDKGNIFMDTPSHLALCDLELLAQQIKDPLAQKEFLPVAAATNIISNIHGNSGQGCNTAQNSTINTTATPSRPPTYYHRRTHHCKYL